jgi:hypothetical protein
VAAARAPEGDGQVRLALGHEGRQELAHHRLEVAEELDGGVLRQHVVAHRGVAPGERPQLVDPVRVGQEPAVEHQVGVERQAVLVAERQQRDLHRRLVDLAGEQGLDAPAQGVDVEVARVDHHVGLGLDGFEQLALALDGGGQVLLVAAARERVAATRVLVPADQGVGRGVEEQDPHPGGRRAQPRQHGQDLVLVGARADDQRHPPDRRARHLRQLDDLGDQAGRQVVDDEPAEVLEVVGRHAAPGAGQAGDDDELAHEGGSSRGSFSATSARRRGMVAAPRYWVAPDRNPGGGSGSSMWVT